jgi:hypothetical protein
MIDAGKKKAAELGKAINPPRSRCLDTSGEAFLHNQGPKQTFASCSQTGESKLAPAICCRCRILWRLAVHCLFAGARSRSRIRR